MLCRWLPLILILFLTLPAGGPAVARAAIRSFPAGSVVIPVDPCWQPLAAQPVSSGCTANGSLAGAAGAYGLAYRLQRAGVPVYLADSLGAEERSGITVVIGLTDQAPAMLQPDGIALDPPLRVSGTTTLPAHLVDYRGQPFVLDGRDLNPAATAILATAPLVRRHHVQVPFSTPVGRVLTGLPTRVSAPDQTGVARLESLLELAGLAGDSGLTIILADSQYQSAIVTAASACSSATALLSPFAGACGLPALFDDLAAVPPATRSRETVTTTPLVAAGVLFTASARFPGGGGHLRALALNGNRQTRLWDAAEKVPLPGFSLPPATTPELAELAPTFTPNPQQRQIFTNLPAAQGCQPVNFTAQAAAVLQPLLGVDTTAAAAALINAVRGRSGTSAADPAGSGDRPVRLGAISRSSPALVGGSQLDLAAGERDRVLYAGAEDGLLHAILAGQWQSDRGYDHATEPCGRELWAYLPGSLLPALTHQPFDDPTALAAVHVDGSPLLTDLFIDSDGDGRREWRTVLVGTASVQSVNRGVVFALDVSDPYGPRLLWETPLPATGLGRSRGVATGHGSARDDTTLRLFLTAGTAGRISAQGHPDPLGGSYGSMASALDMADGERLWHFIAPYEGAARNLAEPPSLPALMLAAASGGVDGVIFGDLAGRLWALDPVSGAPLGGRPVWQTATGAAEPIGGGIAVRNRLALFGTGGVEHADPDGSYAVYAVEILPEGGRLLWSIPLARGERLWGAPSFDRFGRIYLGLGSEADGTGRLLVLDADGTVTGSVALAGVPYGGLALLSGAVVAVARSGDVDQFGDPREISPHDESAPGRIRVFSWRVR
jgi:outer membrane protein assembly factor BamB